MLLHMSIPAAALVLWAIFGKNDKKMKIAYFVLMTLIMAFVCGSREYYGTGDLPKYYGVFVRNGQGSYADLFSGDLKNIGFWVFCKICYDLFAGNFSVCLYIIALFSNIALAVLIYRHSPKPHISYVMYIAFGFYFFTFSGLKQTMAMAFLMIAILAILEKRQRLFYVMAILAGFFHQPAFIFLPAYFIATRRLTKMYFIVLLAVAAIVIAFRGVIVEYLSDLYYDERDYTASKLMGGKFIMMVLMLIAGFVLRRVDPKNDPEFCRLFSIMIVAAMIQSFSVFGHNFTRLADYYFQTIVIYCPLVLTPREDISYADAGDRMTTAAAYRIATIAVCVLAVIYYYSYIEDDISGVLNLKFFWEV